MQSTYTTAKAGARLPYRVPWLFVNMPIHSCHNSYAYFSLAWPDPFHPGTYRLEIIPIDKRLGEKGLASPTLLRARNFWRRSGDAILGLATRD